MVGLQKGPGNRAVSALLASAHGSADQGITVQRTGGEVAGDANFIHDPMQSTIDLLPEAEQSRFKVINWGRLDYPGNKSMPVNGMTHEERTRWNGRDDVVLNKKGTHFIGTHQLQAEMLFKALARVRPGGGERRVNSGKNAVLTKQQFATNPDEFDTYISNQLAHPKSQDTGRKKMLNKHAATAFAGLYDAAAAEGIDIRIVSAFRERKRAQANAKKAGNAKAVASYSSHSLGLAMDLLLWSAAMANTGSKWTEVSTGDFRNIVRMTSSPVYKFLYMHGADHGFYQYRAEPWHWEYNPPGFREKFFSEQPGLI